MFISSTFLLSRSFLKTVVHRYQQRSFYARSAYSRLQLRRQTNGLGTSRGRSSSPAASPTYSRGESINHDLNMPSLQVHNAPTNASEWSKSNLRPEERGSWTRGWDGRREVGAEIRSVSFFRHFCFWTPCLISGFRIPSCSLPLRFGFASVPCLTYFRCSS